jgi:hypothetical protein
MALPHASTPIGMSKIAWQHASNQPDKAINLLDKLIDV